MSKIFRTLAVATCLLGIAFSQEFAPSEKFSEHVHEAQARLFNRDLPINEIERALESGSDSILVGRGMRFFTDTNPDTVSARSASMICSADTIAIVLIENHESFFSSRKDWIFTDYAAKVRRVIKNDAIHPLQPGAESRLL